MLTIFQQFQVCIESRLKLSTGILSFRKTLFGNVSTGILSFRKTLFGNVSTGILSFRKTLFGNVSTGIFYHFEKPYLGMWQLVIAHVESIVWESTIWESTGI